MIKSENVLIILSIYESLVFVHRYNNKELPSGLWNVFVSPINEKKFHCIHHSCLSNIERYEI